MRIATHALQHKQRLLEGARRRLQGVEPTHVEGVVEPLFRAVVSRLGEAPTSRETLARLSERFPSPSLEAVARAIAAAVVEDLPWSATALMTLSADMDRALASVLEVVAPLARVVRQDHATTSGGGELASALSEIVLPHVDTVVPPSLTRDPRALLRLRATSPAMAEALAAASERAIFPPDVDRLPSSPDEVLLTAPGLLDEAALALVRSAQAISRALGPRGFTEVAAALVELGAANDDGGRRRALVQGAVRASSLAVAGEMTLDEASWRSCSFALAEIPARERTVDPAAPFRNDRWELSSLLVRPRVVGREEEVAALKALLPASPTSSRARLVLLHGPTGIGKTTLLRLVLDESGLGDEEAPVLWGASDALLATPYAAFVGMLRALAGAPAGHPRARARLLSLVDGLGDALPEDDRRELVGLLPVLAYLIGAVDEDASATDPDVEAHSPRGLQIAIRRAALLLVEALMARANGRRAIMVVTGGEVLDAPTQELLAFLGRRLGARLTVVLVSSSRPRLAKSLHDRFAVGRHEVKPLPPDAAKALLESVLEEPVAADALAPLIDRARGSPLSLLQLVRFAVEGGFLTRADGRWDPSGLNARDLPGRVERALARRMRRLPDEARCVLGCCAVLGLSFRPRMVEHVASGLGVDGPRARRATMLLLETGFLVESRRPAHPTARDGEDDEATLSFSHPVLRPVAADSLDEEQQGRAHLLAAQALEKFLLAGSHAVAPQLARHLRLAGEHAAAVRPLTVAVRRAVRLDDRAGAQALAREGLALVGDEAPAARFDLELEMERVLEKSGDVAVHNDAVRRLVRLSERTADPRRQCQALHRVARFNLLHGDADRAEEAARRALELSRPDADVRAQVQALRLLALARLERRELEGAEDALAYARFLTTEDDARTLGLLDHQRGLLRLEAGDPVGALEHLLSAVALHRSLDDVGAEGAALDAVAAVYTRTGRPDRARDLLLRAVELRDCIGDDAGRAQSTLHLGEAALTLGDVVVSEELATAARDLARASSLERLELSAALLAARAALARNDANAAESLIESVRRRVDEARDPYCAMEAALLSARAKQQRAGAAQGAARDRLLKTALRRAKEASALGDARGWLTGRALGAAVYAEVLAEMGDGSAAVPFSQRALELLEGQGRTGLPAEEVLGAHARVCEVAGDLDEARHTLERAIRLIKARAARLPDNLRDRYLAVPTRAGLFDALLRLDDDRV